jgi:hypothetical protein
MCGKSEYDWNTMPMSRLLVGVDATSTPSIRMLPASTVSSPDRARRAVVFPQPDGPSRATNSPGAMARSIPERACIEP